MGYIYKITCKDTNKIYVGKSESSVETRWKEHCRAAFLPSHGDYNFPFHRAIRKYGIDNFIVETIDKTDDSEELKEKEKYWINFYNSYYQGYNATLGGDGQSKYNYDDIVNYYLTHNNSMVETCKYFQIYDQVVYAALKSKEIDYKNLLKRNTPKRNKNEKIFCVELNKTFNSMTEIDNYFNKVVHPNIRRCLNGITKKAYGYTWKVVDNNGENLDNI